MHNSKPTNQCYTCILIRIYLFILNMPLENMPPNIQRIKERIRRLTDDMEQYYKDAVNP